VLIILAGGVISLVADRIKSIDEEITTSAGFVSEKATNKEMFSQGEKILLNETQLKLEGASEFARQQWSRAQSLYQQASDARPNDPEGKIYLQNAIARKAGNPLTIAVVVPITASADSAKEVLRGVAQYQAEYNQSPSASVGRLLEVVVVNDMAPGVGTWHRSDAIKPLGNLERHRMVFVQEIGGLIPYQSMFSVLIAGQRTQRLPISVPNAGRG